MYYFFSPEIFVAIQSDEKAERKEMIYDWP